MPAPSFVSSRLSSEAPPPPYEAPPYSAGSKPLEKTDEKRRNSLAKVQPTTRTGAVSTKSTAGPSSSEGERSDKSGGGFFNKIGQAFNENKESRAAKKKVDYYEKLYGFVPKNVMTEAEWSRSRKEAPKERTGKLKSTVYMGHWD